MGLLQRLFQPAYIKENQIANKQAASFAAGVRKYTDVNTLRLDSVIKTDLVTLVRSTVPFQQKWDTLQFVANRMEDPADVFKLVIAYLDSARDAYGVDHMDLNVPVQFSDPAYIKRAYVKEPQKDAAHLALLDTAFSRLPELAPQYQHDAAKIISNHAPLNGDLQKRCAFFIWQNCKDMTPEQRNAALNNILKYPVSPQDDINVYKAVPGVNEAFTGSTTNTGTISFGNVVRLPKRQPSYICHVG